MSLLTYMCPPLPFIPAQNTAQGTLDAVMRKALTENREAEWDADDVGRYQKALQCRGPPS